MVATRRGARAASPTKSNSDELVEVSATPSRSGRRTGTRQQPASQPPKVPGGDEEHLKGQTSTTKRTTRASGVQSPLLDSTHEADVSDSESCCSAVSELGHPILRRGRRKAPGRSSNQSAELSDADSFSSVTSACIVGPLTQRGRTKRAAAGGSGQSESILMESEESCGSVVSDTQRVTRSLRRNVITRRLANLGVEDKGDVSEADSCTSSLSAAPSTSRRSARSRTSCSAEPTPMNLEEASDLPQSPAPSRRTRGARAAPVVDLGVWDSEGFESGPSVTPRRSNRKRTAPRYTCSGGTDSDESSPVSSQTGSRNKSLSRLSVVVERARISVVQETERGLEEGADMVEMLTEKPCHLGKVSVSQGMEEESVLEDSKLDVTKGPEDVTLTLEKEEEEKKEEEEEKEEEEKEEEKKEEEEEKEEEEKEEEKKEEEEKEEEKKEEKEEEKKEEEVIDLTDQDEPVAVQGFCKAEESQGGIVIVPGEEPLEVSEAANEPTCGPAVAMADQQGGQSHSAAETEEDTAAMNQEPEAAAELELCTGDTGGVTVCYDTETADKEGEEEDINVTSSSSAHSPELDDACHLVLSDEEGEQEKVEGDEGMLEEKKVMMEEEQEHGAEGELVILEEEQEQVEVVMLEEEKVRLEEEQVAEGEVVMLEEGKKEDVVVIDQEEEKEEEMVVIQLEEEEEDVVVLEEQQEEEAVVVERKEAQVTVLKEQEEVAEEENKEEVNVVIEKKVDSVLVVMKEDEEADVVIEKKVDSVSVGMKEDEEADVVIEKKVDSVSVGMKEDEEADVVIEKKVDSLSVVMEADEGMEEEMEVSVSAPQALHTGSEATLQPLLPDSIQVNSSQKIKVVVSEPPHTDQPHGSIIIQKTKVVSLLDSSEDEEEEESSGEEEEEEDESENLAGLSQSKPVSEGLFVIDKRPGQQEGLFHPETNEEVGPVSDDEEEFVDEEGDEEEDDDDKALYTIKNQTSMELSSRIDAGLRARELGGLYVCFDGGKSKGTPSNNLQKKKRNTEDQVMQRSVIGPEFEKQEAVPPYSESKQALKLKRKEEREKSTGDGWFNMRAPEMTAELKGDLKALKMRAAMDPKRFYKKNDRDGFPKYFQVGTVVDSPVDFYHSRIPKKNRKRTMVEELLADAEFRHSNKKKYQKIMTEKAALGAGRKRNKHLTNKKLTNKKKTKKTQKPQKIDSVI